MPAGTSIQSAGMCEELCRACAWKVDEDEDEDEEGTSQTWTGLSNAELVQRSQNRNDSQKKAW